MSIKKQFYDEGFIIIRNLINEELITNILESLKEFKTKIISFMYIYIYKIKLCKLRTI